MEFHFQNFINNFIIGVNKTKIVIILERNNIKNEYTMPIHHFHRNSHCPHSTARRQAPDHH